MNATTTVGEALKHVTLDTDGNALVVEFPGGEQLVLSMVGTRVATDSDAVGTEAFPLEATIDIEEAGTWTLAPDREYEAAPEPSELLEIEVKANLENVGDVDVEDATEGGDA
jgi:hypothetical protein